MDNFFILELKGMKKANEIIGFNELFFFFSIPLNRNKEQ